MATGWNHNIQYHDVILRSVPADCTLALDVGAGRGGLARKLASRCANVVAIDADLPCLTLAEADSRDLSNVKFAHGDVLSYPFEDDSFDLVVVLATLHHLPLHRALLRFRSLLKPGGVLVIVGLYRKQRPLDFALITVALPLSWLVQRLRGAAQVAAPIKQPAETLKQIRSACDALLPGGTFRLRLFFRYTFVWKKPASASLRLVPQINAGDKV